MGKKRLRTKRTSKGSMNCVSPTIKKLTRATGGDLFMQKFRAYQDGKNPWITIDNPNPHETNKRRIRVKANEFFANRNRTYTIKAS